MSGSFTSPAAFRQSLESRLRALSGDVDFNRRRQLFIFQRALARLSAAPAVRVVLKGGLALEVRLDRARTTRDVDLCWYGDQGEVFSSLRSALRTPTADADDAWFVFEVSRDAQMPDFQSPGLKYGGERFRVTCQIGGVTYGSVFGIDVAVADPFHGVPDRLRWPARAVLDGLAGPELDVLPVAAHIAEKLHAYTQPRPRPNSRVRDLPDLALLATVDGIESVELSAAIRLTFEARGTHQPPIALPVPPASWEAEAKRLVAPLGLGRVTLASLHQDTAALLDPILRGGLGRAMWKSADRCWIS